MKRNRSRSKLAVGLVVSALVLAACGDGADADERVELSTLDSPHSEQIGALAAAAADSGQTELVIYGSSAEEKQPAWDLFTKRYGITVKAQNLVGTALTSKLEQEKASGKVIADVIQSTKPTAQARADEGYYQAFTPVTVDENIHPISDAGEGLFYAPTASVFGMVYNTQRDSEEEIPQTWDDLLKPEWKDQLALLDPKAQNGTTLAFATLASAGVIDDQWLKNLAANGASNSGDAATMLRQIATGEHPIGVGIPQHMVWKAAKDGAPVGMSLSTGGGTVVTPVIYGLMNNAPHSAAAELFITWLYTKEAQEAMAALGEMPLLSGAQAPEGVASLDQIDNVVEVARGDVLYEKMTAIVGLNQVLY